MAAKLKATAPLALSIAVLAFLYVEFTTNFDFHWVTSGNLGNGLDLPANFQFAVPIGFVAWGLFFAVGANNAAAREVAVNLAIGCLSALVLFFMVHNIATIPNFWGIALSVGILAFVLVLASGVIDQMNVPVIFCAFAGVVAWWFLSGAQGWAPGAVGHSLKALASPKTAGQGAFGGVLSLGYGWVALDVFATLLLGLAFGMVSVRLAALLTPGTHKREDVAAADERVAHDERVARA